MTHYEALDWINAMPAFSSERYGLDGVSKLLDKINNPHLKLKYIHIAGTNGKGSTAVFCSSSLVEANFKTGLFISPYIFLGNQWIKQTIFLLEYCLFYHT